MRRHWVLMWSAVLAAGTSATAQVPFKFQFKAGQPLTYRTSHETRVEVKQGEETSASTSKVQQVKRWDVRKVDSFGVATLVLTVQALSLEQIEPDGESIHFDSEDPEGSNPQLAEQLKAVVGQPILEVQIDKHGHMKHYKHLGDKEEVLRELPFVVTIPGESLPAKNLQWKRDFPIQLDPPLGNHETLRGMQICAIEEATTDRILISVRNEVVDEIKEPKRRVPIVQFLPKGIVELDPRSGRMVKVQMKIDETIKDFDGEGGTYKFASEYVEELETSAQQADRRE